MIKVSNEYKVAMADYFRNNAFAVITIGVVDDGVQDAVTVDGVVGADFMWWSNITVPISGSATTSKMDYATLEQNFLRCDSTQQFLPDKSSWDTSDGYCLITTSLLGSVEFSFDGKYNIKGLYIDFTDNYPTEFIVESDTRTSTFTNNSRVFTTLDVIGNDTTHLKITPVTMVGGQQRLRIASITMGAGLILSNNELTSASVNKYCSLISEELPSTELSVEVVDYSDNYNYDNPDSLINYLKSGQHVNVKLGQTLNDGSVEYVDVANLFLSTWSSSYGTMSFTAEDVLYFWNESNYVTDTSVTIHTRTIYDDCVEILTAMSLTNDDYILDDYLKNITITNPLPEATHSSLLQLLANASRCILYQNNKGQVVIKPNFPYQINQELATSTNAPWGSLSHLLDNTVSVHYSDFTSNFSIVDATMLVLPETSSEYLDGTGFVSSEVADNNGKFTTNPQIECVFDSGFSWTSLKIQFAGNHPQQLVCHTSYNGQSNDDVVFNDLQDINELIATFGTFDYMQIEITEGAPNSRVLIDYIGFDLGTDYKLERHDMLENVLGTSDEIVKDVRVRIISFVEETDSEGNIVYNQVDDEVYYTLPISDTGTTVTYENQLISTEAMAKDVAMWLGAYYTNMLYYETDYRGEPKLEAGDYIKMENDYNDNLTTQIEKAELQFNGAYNGTLKVRRAAEVTFNVD